MGTRGTEGSPACCWARSSGSAIPAAPSWRVREAANGREPRPCPRRPACHTTRALPIISGELGPAAVTDRGSDEAVGATSSSSPRPTVPGLPAGEVFSALGTSPRSAHSGERPAAPACRATPNIVRGIVALVLRGYPSPSRGVSPASSSRDPVRRCRHRVGGSLWWSCGPAVRSAPTTRANPREARPAYDARQRVLDDWRGHPRRRAASRNRWGYSCPAVPAGPLHLRRRAHRRGPVPGVVQVGSGREADAAATGTLAGAVRAPAVPCRDLRVDTRCARAAREEPFLVCGDGLHYLGRRREAS
ncbi:hypothetical protein SAFG77S_00902 [Streptomyces afghaniensis]